MKRLGRRKFIQAALGAAACPMLLRCEFVNVRSDGAAEAIDFDIAKAPYTGLQTVGGYACVQFGAVEVLILRRSQDSIVAYERMCPHLNFPLVACDGASGPATLKFDQNDQVIECTYHYSLFSAVDGSFIAGEAQKDLLRFAVDFDMATGIGTVSPETV